MSTPRRLGLLGGTFDPIHVGHVAAALAVRRALHLDEVWLLASHVPPHRPQPAASVHHRFAMVALAVQDDSAMRASDVELLAPGPSYTAATLARLHAAGFDPSQLFFILGADAFAEISTWRDYPSVLDGANFAIVTRGGRRALSDIHGPGLVTRLHDTAAAPGSVGGDRTGIYAVDGPTPDVSSTAVRDRCARGLSIAGMVAPAVERHIVRHLLYKGRSDRERTIEHVTANQPHEQEHL
jgi:nicotinate-nucleotide adenylyltransferase